MTYTQLYNAFEVLLWSLFALECVRRAVLRKSRPVPSVIAAAAFALFAVSDWIEISTGAWWRPWWLLVMKGTCILTVCGLVIEHVRHQRSKEPTADESPFAKEVMPSES